MSILSTYDIYTKTCTALASSIVIKHLPSAHAMNVYDKKLEQYLTLKTNYTPFVDEYDIRTWRYTYHLSGRYHPLDLIELNHKPIQVKSIDTLEMIDFTVEMLKLHKGTAREYRKKDTYYQMLIKKYPEKITLINGILNPIKEEKIINARENEILSYDKSLVEYNEYSLMMDLQEQIDLFFKTINNDRYQITDDLFIPARLGILYIYLPKIIMDIRYRYARSIEAHTFHVWSWLGSHQWLDEYRYHLNLYQRMWFYRNMKWVEANAGKTETFEKLTDVVMTGRGLPLAGFDYENTVDEMKDNNTIMYPSSRFRRIPLNLHDSITSEGKIKTTNEMVKDGLPEARDNAYWVDIDRRLAERKLARSNVKNVPVKVLESRVNDISKRNPIRKEDVSLNTWVYMATNDLYKARINILNPRTSEIMNVDQKEALTIFLYVMHRALNLPLTHIPSITARRVYTVNRAPLKTMMKWIDQRYTDKTHVEAIDFYTPDPEVIISTESFAQYIEDVYLARMIHRNIYSYIEEARSHDQIKTVVANLQQDTICYLTKEVTSYEDWFKDRGWDLFDIGQADASDMMLDITSKSLGNDIFVKQSLSEIQGMMIRLLKQLSSYSIQFIKKITSDDIVMIDWSYVRPGRGELNLTFKNLTQTHLAGVDVFRLRNRLFHKGKEALFPATIKHDDVKGKLFSDDKVDMILDLIYDHKTETRTQMRLPSAFVSNPYVCMHAAEPSDANEHPWDLEDFRIHKSTEDRSFVKVSEDGQLIVRGVVYLKDGETGAKKLQLTNDKGQVDIIDYTDEDLLEIAACKSLANMYPACPIKTKPVETPVESPPPVTPPAETHQYVNPEMHYPEIEDFDGNFIISADIGDFVVSAEDRQRYTHLELVERELERRKREKFKTLMIDSTIQYHEQPVEVNGRMVNVDVLHFRFNDFEETFALPCTVTIDSGYSHSTEAPYQLDTYHTSRDIRLTESNCIMTRRDGVVDLIYNHDGRSFEDTLLVKDTVYTNDKPALVSLTNETRPCFIPLKQHQYVLSVYQVKFPNTLTITAYTQEN